MLVEEPQDVVVSMAVLVVAAAVLKVVIHNH
jgi:hypothetical protein